MSKVSIIIPFFNASKTIISTLHSVKRQTYKKFECILIDDGSSDSSNLIVRKYISKDKRFKLFKQTNQGVVSARNLGIKKSSNRYIAFLDADDIWDSDFLKESINFREEQNRPIAITHSRYFRFEVKNEKINYFFVKPPLIINHRNILNKNYIPLLTVIIDRNVIKNLYFDNQRPEDYRLWIKLIYINKFESISINKALGFYRISKNQRSKNKFNNLKRIYRIYGELPNSNFFITNFNTLRWIFYNSLQRIFPSKNKNKEKLAFLSSILFNYK
tara:strand:+ start:862 stop:1680 length:819 start_codon:yes stop_codon:yes gene_type:complete